MASRQGAHVSRRVDVDGGESPNAFIGKLTVDMRAFWPPYTVDKDQVIAEITAAAQELISKVRDAEPPPAKGWLRAPSGDVQ